MTVMSFSAAAGFAGAPRSFQPNELADEILLVLSTFPDRGNGAADRGGTG